MSCFRRRLKNNKGVSVTAFGVAYIALMIIGVMGIFAILKIKTEILVVEDFAEDRENDIALSIASTFTNIELNSQKLSLPTYILLAISSANGEQKIKVLDAKGSVNYIDVKSVVEEKLGILFKQHRLCNDKCYFALLSEFSMGGPRKVFDYHLQEKDDLWKDNYTYREFLEKKYKREIGSKAGGLILAIPMDQAGDPRAGFLLVQRHWFKKSRWAIFE